MISNWIILLSSTYGSGQYNVSNYNGISVGPITVPADGNVTIGNTTLPVTGPAFLAIVAAIVLALAAGLVWWIVQRRRRQAPVA